MTLCELAKLLTAWPDSSPSWLEVGQWLGEINDPTTAAICVQLARRDSPAPDFGRSEEGFMLRWYHNELDALATVRIEGKSAAVEIYRANGGGSTQTLELP